jgi:hypothetical protein
MGWFTQMQDNVSLALYGGFGAAAATFVVVFVYHYHDEIYAYWRRGDVRK